jgi:hypothetical protein
MVWIENVAYDLNQLIDPSTRLPGQYFLSRAVSVNNKGQIAASYNTVQRTLIQPSTGGARVVLLNPKPQ